MISLDDLEGFQWDAGNSTKSRDKHYVTPAESEPVFFNQPLLLPADEKHSQVEPRYLALGRTIKDRKLFLVFTVRDKQVRVVSSRDMSRKERMIYDKA